jgi:6-phosphogluconolactonase
MAQSMREIRVLEDLASLTAAAAEEVARAAERSIAEQGRFTWALSGGGTPRGLFQRLAGDPYRERIDWSRVHFFWGDERHVPPDDAESNYRMARETMIDALSPPAENVHRIHAEEPDAAVAARLYEAELRSFFALGDGEWPRFDLMLMGIGKDGHTASLFPGGEAVHERERIVVAPWVPSQNTFRITLTPPAINRAARSLFLVSGEEKSEALRAVLEGAREPDRYPAQIVEGNVLWMVDRSAARLLKAAG